MGLKRDPRDGIDRLRISVAGRIVSAECECAFAPDVFDVDAFDV